MKIVAQDGAIAALAFVADEVKPLKGFHLPYLLRAVGERYEATRSPTVEEARKEGARFDNCRYKKGNKEIAITQLGLFSDSFSITTTDTEDSEIILKDLFEWLKSEYKFRDPNTPALSLYQSDLIVNFQNDPAEAFPLLGPFMDLIQREMTPATAHTKKDVRLAAIVFGADPTGSGPTPTFSVARREGVPWRLGMYFSKAHMRTNAHIEALELLDKLLDKKR